MGSVPSSQAPSVPSDRSIIFERVIGSLGASITLDDYVTQDENLGEDGNMGEDEEAEPTP